MPVEPPRDWKLGDPQIHLMCYQNKKAVLHSQDHTTWHTIFALGGKVGKPSFLSQVQLIIFLFRRNIRQDPERGLKCH